MKKIEKLCIATAATFMLTACNNDLYKYDEMRSEQLTKDAFATNFVKEFGEIPADQTWDFSGGALLGIAGSETRATRATGIEMATCAPDDEYAYYDEEGWYNIPAITQTSMNVFKENVNNSSQGPTYAMSTPENSFTIIPLRQGYTANPYELHMVVGSGENAVDYLLWKKGEMMQTSPIGTQNWSDVTTATSSFTYGSFDVRSKAITFKNMPVDEPMYFYVYRPHNNTYPSSLDGYVKDFTDVITAPEQLIADGKKVKILGVETQLTGADYDYEDIMFMIVGDPFLPDEIIPLDKLKFTQTVTKRYMIEDLGVTDDTDYNDIVVDMETTRTITFTYNESTGEITNRTYSDWGNQTATIRHLGGTLNFKLKIGDTELQWMKGEMGANPNVRYDVSGWNPDTNNISITVKQTSDNEGVNSITFPAVGSVPLIIATSTTQPWMEERVSIIPTLKKLIINQQSEE